MSGELEADKDFWWSKLQEFGEEVLRPQRKRLGLTQAQMARRIGVDQSRVSRVELWGARPKDYPTAQRYALCYQLSEEEVDEWLRLLSGVAPDEPQSDEALVDYYSTALLRISQADIGGNVQLAAALADDLAGLLTTHLSRQAPGSPVQREYLRMLEIVLEMGCSVASGACFSRETAIAIKRDTLKKTHAIVQALNDPFFGILYELSCGRFSYIRKQYDRAAWRLSRALTDLKNEKEEVPLECLVFILNSMRLLALSLARLKEQAALGKVEDEMRAVLDRVPFSRAGWACHALEGLACAQGRLKLPQAFDTLEETQQLIDEVEAAGTKAPVRRMQLKKTELITIQQLEPTDKTLLERVGAEALLLAQIYGYERYEKDVTALLTTCL